MPNYQNGKLYTIRSHQTDKVYVGSTTQTLSVRMAGHRMDFKRYNTGGTKYVTSFELLKYDDAYIELIELYPCNSKGELDRAEGAYIRQMDCVNKIIAGRTQVEYYQDNKEYIREKKKEYYQNNKEELTLNQKQYYQNNKEKINEYQVEYRQNNKDEINEYQVEYRQNNKEKINKKFSCECGGKYTANGKIQHLRAKKHQKYLNKEIINEKISCECGGKYTANGKPQHLRTKKHQKYFNK